MAAGRLDELMNVNELTECMRRTDYMNPARRRPPGKATQGDRLSKYRKSLDVADGFAGKIRRYISALSTCLKEDGKARGSLDSHVLNLAMHLLFYSIRFTLRGYPTSSPMHKRLAQHVSARLARVVLDAVRAQSSEARPAVATIVQPASYVQYEHGQVLRPDGSSCFSYASEGMHQIYGLSPESVREDASAVFARLHPHDLERVGQSIQVSAERLTPSPVFRQCNGNVHHSRRPAPRPAQRRNTAQDHAHWENFPIARARCRHHYHGLRRLQDH
jgi:hypothetical protein